MIHWAAWLIALLAVVMATVSLPAGLFLGLAAGAVEVYWLSSPEYRAMKQRKERDHAHRNRR